MKNEIEKKLKQYETFVEEKLKPDLKDIEGILLSKSCQYKEWKTLKETVMQLEEFKKKDVDLHLQFNIGNNLFSFAEITSYERTYVDVGLGYLLEMNFEEAAKYSDIRMRLLKKEIDYLRKQAVNVKVHIKMVLLAISELQSTLVTVRK